VSEIGFGAWGIGGAGWIGARDDESRAALHEAVDRGINFFDTALMYGEGHSERLIGEVARTSREPLYVATKIPPVRSSVRKAGRLPDFFPEDHLIACTERSLTHLNRDWIDLQQLHAWRDAWFDDLSWLETLGRLKDQGKIRAIGVSLNNHDPDSGLRLVNSGLIDAVQVIYNIFDPSPAQSLFPACERHQVGVLVRCPFDEGGLTGQVTPATRFPRWDFRNSYFGGNRKTEVSLRADRLQLLLGLEARTLPELALRYCLAPNAVTTVLAGMRTDVHVRENVAVSDGRRLSEGLLRELAAHAWTRDYYAADTSDVTGRLIQSAKRMLPQWMITMLKRVLQK
jgi:aryl-alcohol dehydrogenase-like predicted oxidoreductase